MIKAVTHPDSGSCVEFNNRWTYTIKKDFYMVNCKVDTLGIAPVDCDTCMSGFCLPYVVGDNISYQFTSMNFNTLSSIRINDANGDELLTTTSNYTQYTSESKSIWTTNVFVDMEAIINANPELNFNCFSIDFKFEDLYNEEIFYTYKTSAYCMVLCDEYSVVFDSLYVNKDCNGYTYSSVNGSTYSNFLRLKGRVYYNSYNLETQISDTFFEITKKSEDSYIFECTTQLPEWVVKKFKACVMGSEIVVRTYKGSTMLNEYSFIVRKGADMNNDSGIMWNLKQEFLKICEVNNLC